MRRWNSSGDGGEVFDELRNLRLRPRIRLCFWGLWTRCLIEQIVKASNQAAFRTSATRAALGVDVTPTLESVLNFADMLTAEAEALAISEIQPQNEVKSNPPTTKVKAMSTVFEEKPDKGAGKSKGDGKQEERVCRFWGSEDGCRKGQDCRFKHEWGSLEKKGRCFGCSSTKHTLRRSALRQG